LAVVAGQFSGAPSPSLAQEPTATAAPPATASLPPAPVCDASNARARTREPVREGTKGQPTRRLLL